VRLRYARSAALRYPLGCLRLVLPPLLQTDERARFERVNGVAFDDIVEHWRMITPGHPALIDTARTLADQLPDRGAHRDRRRPVRR
jgi:hypothetical protein